MLTVQSFFSQQRRRVVFIQFVRGGAEELTLAALRWSLHEATTAKTHYTSPKESSVWSKQALELDPEEPSDTDKPN
jgi:hypothetical protein